MRSLIPDQVRDGNAQRSRLAIALGDLHPLDGLRSVRALPQRRPQLVQIKVCLRCEPPDAQPVHACRTFVGLHLVPSHLQRCRRRHLVDQTVPLAAFDAVIQRRQHARRPNRGFNPGPVAPALGLCTLCSLVGTAGARLPRSVRHVSTFLPPFPRRGFAARAFRDPAQGRNGTMRALTPGALATHPPGLTA